MEASKTKTTDMDALIQEWLQTANDFWMSMLKAMPAAPAAGAPDAGGFTNRYAESLEVLLKRL